VSGDQGVALSALTTGKPIQPNANLPITSLADSPRNIASSSDPRIHQYIPPIPQVMSWFSILPPSISFIETWAIRIFLMLGILAIGPWFLLIIYDMILYVFRTATYEVPVIGGRARNRPRPRAPSLSERPSGKPRSFSLTSPGVPVDSVDSTMGGLKKRLEKQGHNRGSSNVT